jgi:hypothetical protein
MGNFTGIIYFLYYGSLGYFTNYEKHLLWRDLCSKQWNKNNENKNKIIEINNINGKSECT